VQQQYDRPSICNNSRSLCSKNFKGLLRNGEVVKMTTTGFKPIHSSKLVGRMVNGVPKGTRSYIAAKTRELKEEERKKKGDKSQ
jgi:hypothetical protein